MSIIFVKTFKAKHGWPCMTNYTLVFLCKLLFKIIFTSIYSFNRRFKICINNRLTDFFSFNEKSVLDFVTVLWHHFIFQNFDYKCLISFDLNQKVETLPFTNFLTFFFWDIFFFLPSFIPRINLKLKYENATQVFL